MQTRWSFDTVATVVLVGCAMAISALVIRREMTPVASISSRPAVRETIANWAGYHEGGQTIGSRAAPVTIVLFSDFQCPFCATLATRIDVIRQKYGDSVRVQYRHFPLTRIHDFALEAAIASECAGDQGYFEAYHNTLYAQQSEIGQRSWADFARDAGVPSAQEFQECLETQTVRVRVENDIAAAMRLELKGTPAVLVNSQLVRGTPSVSELDSLIVHALEGK